MLNFFKKKECFKLHIFNIIRKLTRRLWESPTFTTWGTFLTKPLSLILVIPLVLTKLSLEESGLWFLFSIFIGLQCLADMGFGVTFIRAISFAMGGITEIKDLRHNKNIEHIKGINWSLIESVNSTMKYIYKRLVIPLIFFFATIGTLSLIIPISKTDNIFFNWVSWIIIIIVSIIKFLGDRYSVYLQGLNKIALLRRWETIFSIGSILSLFFVLLITESLFWLVITNQLWVILMVIRNWWLCNKVYNGKFKDFKYTGINKKVFKGVFPSAWRSWIGVLMSYGVIQTSGIIYAQLGSSSSVASYLLTLRIMNMLKHFSMAPFYCKIPLLSRLNAEMKSKKLLTVAKRGMLFSHFTYTIPFIIIGFFAQDLLLLIKSNVSFASPLLWSLMGFAFFIERYGAMHIQLYSTTNHIIWHIANGVSGILYLLVSFILLKYIGVYAFPIGIIVGYLGFYSWYSAKHSYHEFKLNFIKFETSTSLAPFGLLLIYIFISLSNKIF